jgi:hypothetical protein
MLPQANLAVCTSVQFSCDGARLQVTLTIRCCFTGSLSSLIIHEKPRRQWARFTNCFEPFAQGTLLANNSGPLIFTWLAQSIMAFHASDQSSRSPGWI